MKLQMKSLLVIQAGLCICMVCACSSSIKADPTKLADLKAAKEPNGEYSPRVTNPEASAAGVKVDVDMAAEGVISKECLEAWRKALKGDGKGAIAQLDDLEKRYPKFSTVKFMKGQVLEQLGRGEEAIKCYREALDNSEYSSIRQFKLAQALLRMKKYKDAEAIYRKLLKTYSDLPDAKLGLARCVIGQDTHSKEGHQLLEETVILCGALLKTQESEKVREGTRVLNEVLEVDPANAGAKQLLGK